MHCREHYSVANPSMQGEREMSHTSMWKERYRALSSRWPQWLPVLLFLVSSRVILNIPALVGANQPSLAEGIVVSKEVNINPRSLPGVWARWDTGYYLKIATNGYSFQGDEVNFFPTYPFFIRLFALGFSCLMPWSGFLIANLAFILAALLLWYQVRLDFDGAVAWGTILSLGVFPTSLFFSAIYAESLFLLFSVLVYWFSVRKQYIAAGVFVAVASLTRITGLLLIVIPLTEILLNERPRVWRQIVATSFTSGMGLSFYGSYLWLSQGSPVAFVLTQQGSMKRWIAWPWQTIFDSLAVIICGRGGFQANWFMRVVSVQDLLATLLFAGCTLMAFFLLRESLVVYSVVAMLALLVAHGPYTLGVYAMSRYVLGLFPGFIVLGILLSRMKRLKWGIWAVWTVILFFLTWWFANGRWVA